MKSSILKNRFSILFAGLMLAASVVTSNALEQIVNTFATSVAGWTYESWNNSPATFSFSTNDANGSASSGSMKMEVFFNPTTNGGAFRFTTTPVISAYTTLEYDVKVDAASPQDQYGTACDFKVGFSDSTWSGHSTDLNISRVTTNGGWQHVVINLDSISTGAQRSAPIQEVFVQVYDNNYTNNQTATLYIDNIKFVGSDPTYPNYTAFTFADANSTASANAPWYSFNADNLVSWSTNDAQGNASSGSAYFSGTFTAAQNNIITSFGFDTNLNVNSFPAGASNIDATHYTAVELDVMWDTNSTLSLSNFNANGDVSGFPLGLMEGQDFGGINNGVEAFGIAATPVPDSTAGGWAHISIPLNRATAGIVDTTGLYFKKWGNNGSSGTYGFWVDNVVFIGAPLAVPQPIMTISKPVKGLNIINASGSPYDRESLATFAFNYTWVDQASPVTYAMNIADFPGPNHAGYDARIYLVPNRAATEAEPDYQEATMALIDIYYTGAGASAVQIHCKTNQPADNGSLYIDANSNSTWVANSPIIGNWTFTFTQNTNILVTAPNGTSTNLPFPLGLTSSDVSSFFGSDMVVYFGGYNNGTAHIGQRIVLASVGITNGSTTLLYDNFLTDTVIDRADAGGSMWLLASGTAPATKAIYLLPDGSRYYLDWTVPATGFLLQTNSGLDPGSWSAVTELNAGAVQLGDHFHTVVDETNLPPAGNLFFRVMKP